MKITLIISGLLLGAGMSSACEAFNKSREAFNRFKAAGIYQQNYQENFGQFNRYQPQKQYYQQRQMPQKQYGCQQQYKQYQPQQQRFNPMQYRQTYGLQAAQQRYGGFNRVTPQWQFIQPTYRGRSFSFR